MGGGDKLFSTGSFIYGWNGATQQLHMWTFWNQVQMAGPVSQEGDQLHFALQGATADGQPMSGNVYHTIEGDTLTIKVVQRRLGNDSLPDIEYQVRRVAPGVTAEARVAPATQ